QGRTLGESDDGCDGEQSCDQIAIGSGGSEGGWQRGGHDPRHKEAEPDKPKRVRRHQGNECVVSRDAPKPRQDVNLRDQPEGHKTQEYTEPKYRPNVHGSLLASRSRVLIEIAFWEVRSHTASAVSPDFVRAEKSELTHK